MKTIKRDGYDIILSDGVDELSDCVLALGNFDGVHIAHSALLDSAKKLKENIGAAHVGVWCFGNIGPQARFGGYVGKIVTTQERVKLFFEHGMDFVVVGDFEYFQGVNPWDFMRVYLKEALGCIGVVCGKYFKFGVCRSGDAGHLSECFGNENVCVVDLIKIGDNVVSSTKIREFVFDGDMESAKEFLGRPFYLNAPVTEGKRLGRTLGFPTANQHFPSGCIYPKRGIYATVCTTDDGKKYIGVSNVGIRPTITDGTDTHKINCETYIIDFEGDIYGQNLKVEFYKLLRDEQKFSSVEELKLAIAKDAKAAVSFFESAEVTL